jgi:spore coat polysaccharide biosynthesis protein SpsF
MIGAIIQSRLGSTRLPGKTLLKVEGVPLLGHLINRIQHSKYIENIVVATTTEKRDDQIVRFCQQIGIDFIRGSEEDVLDRFYRAASHFSIEKIVRVTPDCPMLDPKVTDRVIEGYLEGDYDYASNAIQPTYPDGLDTEIFTIEALAATWREASLQSDREHVTSFIVRHPKRFRLLNVANDEDLSWMRWTVDTESDLRFARQVFSYLYPPKRIFHMEDVIGVLREHPELLKINAGIERNEGYQLSLHKDRCTAKIEDGSR